MPFASDSDIEIINDAGELAPKFAKRVGKGRSKPRYTIEVVSQPLLLDFDSLALGAKPALAIQNALSKEVKSITEVAAISTIRRRERAKRRLSGSLSPEQQAYRRRGATYANSYEKRYTGGRIGTKLPTGSIRLFNDSSRLADGFFVRENKTDKSWTVNVPANRLDPREFNASQFQWMINKLRSLVPALGNSQQLLRHPEVTAAINEAIRESIARGDARDAAKLEQLYKMRKRVILQTIRQLASLAAP